MPDSIAFIANRYSGFCGVCKIEHKIKIYLRNQIGNIWKAYKRAWEFLLIKIGSLLSEIIEIWSKEVQTTCYKEHYHWKCYIKIGLCKIYS